MSKSNVSTAAARSQTIPSYGLRPYQRRAVTFLDERNGLAGLFCEMSTGKTRMTLAYLNERTDARRVLVVSSSEVITDRVWPKEIKEMGLDWLTLTLGSGDVEKRADLLATMPKMGRPVLVAVNLDAYWRYPAEEKTDPKTGKTIRLKLRGLRRAIMQWQPDTVVIDEVDRIANRNTGQAKFAHFLATQPYVKRRLGLTGTPVTEGIEDLFSVYKFIDPTVFGSAWGYFENRYIIKGGFGGYQIIGYRGEDEIQRYISQTAFEVAKSEAIQIPSRRMKFVPVKLKKASQDYYNKMKKEAIVQLEAPDESGRIRRGAALARIVLTSITRLQQISGGFLPVTDDDGRHTVFFGDEKAQKARAIVDWHTRLTPEPRQVVIVCKFLPDIEALRKIIPTAGVISGKVPAEERRRIRDRFRRGEINTLIVQIRTSARGISLTAGSVLIFYSVGHSLKDFAQMRDRLHRSGQKRSVIEYVLIASKIDQEIVEALVDKQQIARKVTRLDYAKGLFR